MTTQLRTDIENVPTDGSVVIIGRGSCRAVNNSAWPLHGP